MEEEKEFLVQFFRFEHLPEGLPRDTSMAFAKMVDAMLVVLPRNPERTTMLRKLLEAKDCAVRAALARKEG